jgi:hypothetical protein
MGMRCLLVALALCLAGCGTIYPLTADPSIPFAEGQVMATARDDGGVDIDLSTAHMGDPGKLSPDAMAYVVWIRPLGGAGVGAAENVGAFKPNPDLKGFLSFKTKHTEIELFVTIEPSPEATQPSGKVVLRGEVTGLKGRGAPAPAPGTEPMPAPAVTASAEAPAAEGGGAPALPGAEPPAPQPPAQ